MDSLKNVLKTKRLPADLCGVKFAKDLGRYLSVYTANIELIDYRSRRFAYSTRTSCSLTAQSRVLYLW